MISHIDFMYIVIGPNDRSRNFLYYDPDVDVHYRRKKRSFFSGAFFVHILEDPARSILSRYIQYV
jgi:hypothetical protein